MKHYIDKDAVIAELEKLYNLEYDNTSDLSCGKKIILRHILHFLNTLEVKEEIFDKSDKTNIMRKCVHKAYERGYDMGVLQTTNKLIHNTKEVDLEKEATEIVQSKEFVESKESPILLIAKHFFELGLKLQKEE